MASATEDWEATCAIHPDSPTNTILDNAGRLLRGSMELSIDLSNLIFCRNQHQPENSFRLWSESGSLNFAVVFWCSLGNDEYQRLQVTLQSRYPHSFPAKKPWMQWINKQASTILHQDQMSYSVCMFLEHQAFDFYTCLYEQDQTKLIRFDDAGPTFYDQTTLVTPNMKNATSLLFPLQRHLPSGQKEMVHTSKEFTMQETVQILPILEARRDWIPIPCPICLETVSPSLATTITCGHAFCRDCITTYLRIKVHEILPTKPQNPFHCPLPNCRAEIKIIACVSKFLTAAQMDRVREWYKDVKNPPCFSLPTCLKEGCTGLIRKEQVDSFLVSCEKCNTRWCELCLKRLVKNKEHVDCASDRMVQFCERYLAATDAAKLKCEERWPWMKLYAKSRIHDLAVVEWIQANGQTCPGCKTGIERIEGCFHVSCGCGTHFCYECGTEIFPPFYGTHHCWEQMR